MRELQFVEPCTLPQPLKSATTVRLGTKWNRFVENEGRGVEVWRCPEPHRGSCRKSDVDCEHVGGGVIEYKWVGPYSEIPARIVEAEHEPDSRTYDSLAETLRDIYGDSFDHHSTVTAMEFVIYPEEASE